MSQDIDRILAGEQCETLAAWERAVAFLCLEVHAITEPDHRSPSSDVREFANAMLRIIEIQTRLRINAHGIGGKLEDCDVWRSTSWEIQGLRNTVICLCPSTIGVSFSLLLVNHLTHRGLLDSLNTLEDDEPADSE